MKKADLILLAAGNSRRFGNDNKLLALVGGKPMFTYAIDMAVEAKQILSEQIDKIIIVSKYEEIESYTLKQNKEFLLYQRNHHSERGISESIHVGVKVTNPKHALLFMVCDQPRMKVETVCRLIHGFLESERVAGVVIDQDGNIGNPCIFSPAMRQALLELTGDKGGKRIIQSLPSEECLYVSAEKIELEDIDCRVNENKNKSTDYLR